MDRALYWFATRTVWEKLAVAAVPLVLGLACICPMTAVWSAQQAAVQHAAETAEAAPSATALAVARATRTAEAIPTSTHTPSPTSTPTVTLPPPTVDVSDCTLDAAFEADITVPDDTPVLVGSSFTKTWRIRNTGTCAWGPGYGFTFTGGEHMGGPESITVPETAPGESVELSVGLHAPAEEGRYRGYWQLCVNQSECFGDRMSVQIVAVAPTATPTAVPTSFPSDAYGHVDCVECARHAPWLLRFRSEPDSSAGVVSGGVRHSDSITIVDAYWHGGDEEWWYLVRGWDEYTEEMGRAVEGWVPGHFVTLEAPEPYPLGSAWAEFLASAEAGWGDITVWDRPGYGVGAWGVGRVLHGTRVEVLDSAWDAAHGAWFYRVSTIDSSTGERVTGWMDGVFLVLSPP